LCSNFRRRFFVSLAFSGNTIFLVQTDFGNAFLPAAINEVDEVDEVD
jgi:hypothetical protein